MQAFHRYYDTDPPPFHPLREVLGGGRVSEGIRAETSHLLGKPGARGSRVPLIMTLEGTIAVRKAAAESLAKRGKPRWCDLVTGDSEDYIRLGRHGGPQAVEAMISALFEGGHGEIDALIRGLSGSGIRRAGKALKTFSREVD